MFDFTFGKIFIIVIIALLVLGPQKTLTLSRTVGQWLAKAQKFVSQAKGQFKQIQDEMEQQVKLEEINNLKKEFFETKQQLHEELEKISSEAKKTINKVEDGSSSSARIEELQKIISDSTVESESDEIAQEFLKNKRTLISTGAGRKESENNELFEGSVPNERSFNFQKSSMPVCLSDLPNPLGLSHSTAKSLKAKKVSIKAQERQILKKITKIKL